MIKPKLNRTQEALNAYLSTKTAAEESLDDVPARSMPGREMAKRQAKTALQGKMDEYLEAVSQRWGAVFVNGPDEAVKEFTNLAEELGPAISVNPHKSYQELAQVVNSAMRADRVVEPTQFAHLMSSYERMAKSVNKSHEAPILKYQSGTVAKDLNELAKHIRKVIVNSGSTVVPTTFLRKEIAEAGLKKRYDLGVMPVILPHADEVDEQILSQMFGGRIIKVNLEDKSVSKDLVANTFKELKQYYNRKTNQNNN